MLELHHHIIPASSSVSLPIQDLWHRARLTEIASIKTLCLAPGDLLLYLCLHFADHNHFVGQLRALCDIAATVRRYNEEIDWTSVLKEAHAYEAEQFVYYALWLARHMLDAGIPAEVLGICNLRFAYAL
jgi:hypothetical protein